MQPMHNPAMTSMQPVTAMPPRDHWIVRTNYQTRTSSYLMLFAITGAQMAADGYGPLAWALLILLFLVYPQLAYWRAHRAASPRQTELNNLLVDSFLFGICAAALGFPLWISFTLLIGTTITHVLYLGIPGVLRSLVAIALGAGATVLVVGFRLAPDTTLATTLLCIIGLTLYLLSLANLAHMRASKLHESRQKLRQSEDVLNRTNATLNQRLGEIQALQVQLSEQANRDVLTGLHNRRYLDAAMARELQRCQREGQALSLILMDIDFFKQVNDSHGHAAGDEVLKALASLLRKATRSVDVASRMGGEEFLLMLPTMPLETAWERAEQCRLAFADTEVLHDGVPILCTVSMGVATFPGHGLTQTALLRSADQALYRAKALGRNCTVVYQPSEPAMDAGSGR
jgi:diguanylate cyclase (GGDEF)-like protein